MRIVPRSIISSFLVLSSRAHLACISRPSISLSASLALSFFFFILQGLRALRDPDTPRAPSVPSSRGRSLFLLAHLCHLPHISLSPIPFGFSLILIVHLHLPHLSVSSSSRTSLPASRLVLFSSHLVRMFLSCLSPSLIVSLCQIPLSSLLISHAPLPFIYFSHVLP